MVLTVYVDTWGYLWNLEHLFAVRVQSDLDNQDGNTVGSTFAFNTFYV